jgi:hypothetical protein
MLTLPLDPTDDRADPAFKDAAACAQWLGQLQLTNLQQAHATLRTQLDEFNRYPLRGLERLHTLELLRETVGHVQSDYARKLVAKALPLSDSELAIFNALNQLWQSLVTGYQRCLQAYIAGDQQLLPYGALLCHRCLVYSGLQILEHLRAGYEVAGTLWQQLHALYAYAEEQGLQSTVVEDALNQAHDHHISCGAIYIKTLLTCHAHPEELSRSQLQLLDRWLAQWVSELCLERTYTTSRGDAQPLAVDLDSQQGLQPLALLRQKPRDSLRYLPMVPLSKLLRVNTILLQQGQTPQQLELGTGISAADGADFLNRLHRYWCEERTSRMAERHDTAQEVQLCYGVEGIYAHIANKPFRQQSKGGSDSASQQIATFGRVLSDTNRQSLDQLGYIQESWLLEEDSILGARLLRHDVAGIRLSPKQLVALRRADSCTLAAISWLTVTRDGQLRGGIHYFPGLPQAVSIKVAGSNAAALLLPALPDLKIPASLVIPRHLFQAGRPLELTLGNGEKQKIKMEISVERGLDYERISFSAMKA